MSESGLDEILGGRYTKFKTSKGEYRFDKVIFTSAVLLLLLFAMTILFINNFDKSQNLYLNCPVDMGRCFNPYFNDSTICGKIVPFNHPVCNQQLIEAPYTYGTKAPWYVDSFGLIAVIILLVSLIINHFTANKISIKDLVAEVNKDD